MTTILSDKRTRVHAVPFRGLWFSNLNYGGVGNTLDDGQADGDLRPFSLASSTQVRIATPAKGDLIEARLTMQFTVPNTAGTTLELYVGTFDTDGITPLTISSEEISRMHKILTGLSAPYTYGAGEEVFIDGLNLMQLIPKRGDANFNEDAFIVGLKLTLAGSSAQWYLNRFQLDCSTQIAEVKK
jgi:hypothetical protein